MKPNQQHSSMDHEWDHDEQQMYVDLIDQELMKFHWEIPHHDDVLFHDHFTDIDKNGRERKEEKERKKRKMRQ